MTARVSLAVSICALSFSISAQAADRYWIGSSSDNWSCSLCWSATQGGFFDGLGEPQAGDDVYVYRDDADAGWKFISYSKADTGVLNSLHMSGTSAALSGYVIWHNTSTSSLAAVNTYVGETGVGGYWLMYGTHTVTESLELGKNAGSRGVYQVDNGNLSAKDELIGDAGDGVLIQGVNYYGYGATNTVDNTLTLGHLAGGSGGYDLRHGLLTARNEIIGDAGTGTFYQSGGTNTVAETLVLAQQVGSQGIYNFLDGVLTALNEIVGDAGEGAFTQGGQNAYGYGPTNPINAVGDTLTLGKQSSGKGTYNLVSGTLSAQSEIIGQAGTGTFNQTGGANTVSQVLVLGQHEGSHGIYNLFDGVLTALNEVIGDAGEGVFTQGQNNYGYGATTNPVNHVDGTLTLGREASGQGTYNLVSGTLSAQHEVVGDAGYGTFNQASGVNNVSQSLVLGQQAGSFGMYNLVDGALTAMSQVVGDAGEGVVTQGNNYGYGSTSPTNTVAGTLTLGKQAGGRGTYNLISGSLTALHQVIGDAGKGIFNQTGGSNSVSGTMTLAKQAGSEGQYNLQGGSLTTSDVVVGDAGMGAFTQTGGAHSANNLMLGKQASGAGAYVLSGGVLTVHGNINGGDGVSSVQVKGGELNFDGGEHVVSVDTVQIADSGVVALADNATTVFQSDVEHFGQEIYIGMEANAIFNGKFEGDGPITGAGTATFNGLFKPGAAPITFTVEGDMALGNDSTSILQIGGLGRGTQYDAINVGGQLTLDGELQISSMGGFAPHLGDSYDVFGAEYLAGQFSLVTLFALGDGLAWKIDYLTDAIGTTDVVRLSVINAVPIPAAIWLIQVPLLGLFTAARIRKRAS